MIDKCGSTSEHAYVTKESKAGGVSRSFPKQTVVDRRQPSRDIHGQSLNVFTRCTEAGQVRENAPPNLNVCYEFPAHACERPVLTLLTDSLGH